MQQLKIEFLDKGWTTSSINRLLKKFRDMGTVDRRHSSNRLQSARMDENIDQVNDMVLSKEDHWTSPKLTAQSVRYHGTQAFLRHLLSTPCRHAKGSAAEML